MRVAAGREEQNLSICLGVTAPPYTPSPPRAMVCHERVASRQAYPTFAQSPGPGPAPERDPALVCGRGLHRGRDADPAGEPRGRGTPLWFCHRLGNARRRGRAAALAAQFTRVCDEEAA